jgi:hypothetical protein
MQSFQKPRVKLSIIKAAHKVKSNRFHWLFPAKTSGFPSYVRTLIFQEQTLNRRQQSSKSLEFLALRQITQHG